METSHRAKEDPIAVTSVLGFSSLQTLTEGITHQNGPNKLSPGEQRRNMEIPVPFVL